MLHPNFKNILIYIFTKDIVFYIFLMFKNFNFTLIEVNNVVQGNSLLFFLIFILPPTLLKMLVYTNPIFKVFSSKNSIIFILFISLFLLIEYVFYVFITSQKIFDINGIYFSGINLTMFMAFFFKEIRRIVKW